MKRFFNWQVMFALILVILSVVFYVIHYLLFHDAHHIFIYLVGDIGFLFLDVLIVMLVLHRLLVYREKQSILKKLNMVIGTFFSEVGTELIKKCSKFDSELDSIRKQLLVKGNWSDQEFAKVHKNMQGHQSVIDSRQVDIGEMKIFLIGKRPFLLSLLGNPNLLEHDSFTNLLWAVFHLTDELAHRTDLKELPDSDSKHLSGDIKRAYQLLILEWLDYMKHLKKDYPYLFSLAMRTNPFDANAVVEVSG